MNLVTKKSYNKVKLKLRINTLLFIFQIKLLWSKTVLCLLFERNLGLLFYTCDMSGGYEEDYSDMEQLMAWLPSYPWCWNKLCRLTKKFYGING